VTNLTPEIADLDRWEALYDKAIAIRKNEENAMTDMGYWQYWHLDKVSEELANNAVKLEIWKTIRGYIENDGESSS